VNPTTASVLFALLGALLGGGVVAAWRVSDATLRPKQGGAPEPAPVVPPGVASVLSVLSSSALVVAADDSVVKASAPAYAMGLVRHGALLVDDVTDLVRQVRRDRQIRETELSIGTAPRQIWVRVAALDSQLTLVLAEDRTRERRVEAIRRDFVANVSHELKTPVGALALLAEAISAAADNPETVRRFAELMLAEGERLTTLVGQIVELSRLQDDEVFDDAGPVDVDTLLAGIIDHNQVEARARRITLARTGTAGLTVRGNGDQLGLAISNLLTNAVAYSPEGSTVIVSATADQDHVAISVVDHGIGIPAEQVERIFERFYRLDPARQRSTGGTGLGLSIVKHVAASHGGDVDVRSHPGAGSTFTLRLPTRQPSPINTATSDAGVEVPR
jgi:two-component system, OmpR family, sensor histidine kinase SenX3